MASSNKELTIVEQFGLAIIECLLTDSQLDFRSPTTPRSGRLTSMLLPNESVREAAQRHFEL